MQEYFKLRTQAVAQLRESGEEPYPHKFKVTTSLQEFIEKYESLETNVTLDNVTVTVAGKNIEF